MYRDRIEFYQALEREFDSKIPVCKADVRNWKLSLIQLCRG